MHAWQWVQKTFPDLLIFHVPNGEDRSLATALKLKRMGVVPGVADFLCFKGPRRVAIELKDEGGKQSIAQQVFEKRWTAEGGEYHVYNSLASFKLAIEAIMLF